MNTSFIVRGLVDTLGYCRDAKLPASAYFSMQCTGKFGEIKNSLQKVASAQLTDVQYLQDKVAEPGHGKTWHLMYCKPFSDKFKQVLDDFSEKYSSNPLEILINFGDTSPSQSGFLIGDTLQVTSFQIFQGSLDKPLATLVCAKPPAPSKTVYKSLPSSETHFTDGVRVKVDAPRFSSGLFFMTSNYPSTLASTLPEPKMAKPNASDNAIREFMQSNYVACTTTRDVKASLLGSKGRHLPRKRTHCIFVASGVTESDTSSPSLDSALPVMPMAIEDLSMPPSGTSASDHGLQALTRTTNKDLSFAGCYLNKNAGPPEVCYLHHVKCPQASLCTNYTSALAGRLLPRCENCSAAQQSGRPGSDTKASSGSEGNKLFE